MQNKLISSPTFYFERALLYILCGLLSFFYGIVASFSLLGFFSINVPWLIIFVIILLSVLAFYLLSGLTMEVGSGLIETFSSWIKLFNGLCG